MPMRGTKKELLPPHEIGTKVQVKKDSRVGEVINFWQVKIGAGSFGAAYKYLIEFAGNRREYFTTMDLKAYEEEKP